MRLIERLEELDRAATPAPWHDEGGSAIETTVDGRLIDRVFKGATDAGSILICEMRNAIPKLLAVVRTSIGLRNEQLRFDRDMRETGRCVAPKIGTRTAELDAAIAALDET